MGWVYSSSPNQRQQQVINITENHKWSTQWNKMQQKEMTSEKTCEIKVAL